MVHPNHMNGVNHNDVIVVALDDLRREAPPISTHNAHYIKYDLEARPPAAPRQKALVPLPFEGESRYATDYIKHPLESRDPVKPHDSAWDHGCPRAFTGKSTYNAHYPWHDPQQAPAVGPKVDITQPSAPFDGTTSYTRDYIRHPLAGKTAPPVQPRQVSSGPFDGTTTYTKDYHKHPVLDKTPRVDHGQGYQPDTGPFQGTTEYTREYLKHAMETRHLVHIEPELRRDGLRQKRPKSAPFNNKSQKMGAQGQQGPRSASRPASRAVAHARG